MRISGPLLAILLSACSAPPLPSAEPSDDAAGKQFRPPPEGRAALYVVHPNEQYVEVSAGQRTLGQLSKGMWLRADLPAGTYDIRCRLTAYSLADTQRLNLAAGQMAFISVRYVYLSDPPCRISVQDEAAGKAAVLAGVRAREITGASD